MRRPDFQTIQERLTRREFLDQGLDVVTLGLLAVGLHSAGVRGLREWANRADFNHEGKGSPRPNGKMLESADIVNKARLVAMYSEAIEKNRPAEIDPTIIRSTLYHTMRLLGLDPALAAQRSTSVYTSPVDTDCAGYICTGTTDRGLSIVLNDRFAAPDAISSQQWWLKNLNAAAHEAGHLAVDRARKSDPGDVEDYGLLGKYFESQDIRGFHRHSGFAGVADLISRRFVDPQRDIEAGFMATVPEEFYAELGRIRFFKDLLDSGLGRSEFASTYQYGYPYGFMAQGLVNISAENPKSDSNWQSFFGGSLSYETLDKLHRTNSRFNLFYGIGSAILDKNTLPKTTNLSLENTAALGVVAFTDFVDHSLSGYGILADLVRQPINQELILNRANVLAQAISRS